MYTDQTVSCLHLIKILDKCNLHGTVSIPYLQFLHSFNPVFTDLLVSLLDSLTTRNLGDTYF